MSKDFYTNTNYEVLTPDGFKDFAGVSLMGHNPVWRIETDSGLFLECTHDHKIYVNFIEHKQVSSLSVGDTICTDAGTDPIISITDTGKTEDVYDLIEVNDGHRYYANGILSSNCQFIAFEETLIASSMLAQLDGANPIRTESQVRWYKNIDPQCTYVIGLDPSMGTGGDNAAIQVWELPTLRQVAEWQHNKTRIEDQVALLRSIGKYIASQGEPEIYWTVENNTLGEAALVVIRDTGEDHFAGTMLHDPSSRGTRKRKGYTTTPRSKQEACASLKRLVENNQLQVNSKALISEMKTFIYRGGSYAARNGMTDDLIMALILVLRMADYIAKWEESTNAALSSNLAYGDEEDDDDGPMPFAFV
jgi:hypothetical protein